MATLYHIAHGLTHGPHKSPIVFNMAYIYMYVCFPIASNSPVEMVPILSEYVHESIIVGLTLSKADGSGVKVLLKQCLQLCFSVILIKTNQLEGGGRKGGGERESN